MAVKWITVGIFIGAVGLAVATGTTVDGLQKSVDEQITGDDTPRHAIKTVNDTGMIRQVTLYDDGTADIYLKTDHGCYNAIEFGHQQSDTVYKTIEAPEFEGPATIDMRSVVETNGPYPNNQFMLELTTDDQTKICVGSRPTRAYFTVPSNWTAK